MTREESLRNQKVIEDLLNDIKEKANKINALQEENKHLRKLLMHISNISRCESGENDE